MVRCGRHSPHSLPALAISSLDRSGSYRSVATLAFKPRTCRRPGLQACPRPHRAEWRGQGTKACSISPTGLSDAITWCPLPEVARRSRPTPMPTARGPHSKETARSLTCELSWPSTMLVRVPSGRQPVINPSRYSSILTGGGIGVGRLARQVRGKYIKQTQAIASSIEKFKGTYRVYRLMYRCLVF